MQAKVPYIPISEGRGFTALFDKCSGSYFYYTSCYRASSAVFLSCAVVALFLAKIAISS